MTPPVSAADNVGGQMDGPVKEDGLEDAATSIASVDKAIISYTTAQVCTVQVYGYRSFLSGSALIGSQN